MNARLILRLFLVATISGSALGPAMAASKAEPATSDGQYVDISPVALPVIYERRLVNYVFVAIRLNLTGGANALALREKEPFFRDAVVKLGHRRPFTRLDDFTKVDEAALRTAVAAEAARIAGPRQIAGVEVVSQTPQRRVGLPRPPKAPAAKAAAPRPAAH